LTEANVEQFPEKLKNAAFWDVMSCGSSQKMAFFIVTTVKTSNLTRKCFSKGVFFTDSVSELHGQKFTLAEGYLR
jgi:hypothetical protein